MSNYTKSTNFATKDNLTPGDPLKVVRGTEIDTEFNNIATAVATKTDNASAAITGGTIDGATVGATTPATGSFTTLAASGTTTLAGALVGAVTQAAFNTVSTTLNLGGAATAVNLGAATGTATVNNTTLAAKAITASTTLAVTGTSTLTGAVTATAGVTGPLTSSSVTITGGSITGITDLAVADGGTGASTAAGGLNNLLPSQTSNANKYLQTDGTNASWDAVSLSTADITGTLGVANGGTGVTTSTGTTNVVLSNSPTLVTPNLGVPSFATLTSATGLPISTGVSGLGTGVATFLATPSSANLAAALTDETGSGANVFATSPTLVTPILGTPTSATLTNATGLPISTGVSGLGTGIATALAVNTGSAGAPVLFNGALGTPTSGTVTNLTGTASININGTVGATTATTGAFTTLSATGVTTLQAGTAALPALTTTGDTNTGLWFPAADTIAASTNGTEKLRLDTTGILGLGVTPNANWGTLVALQISNTAVFSGQQSAEVMRLGSNWYYGAGFKYLTTNTASRYDQVGGAHSWYTAASGTAGNAITFTQAMTLDASGNLGVGTTGGTDRLYVERNFNASTWVRVNNTDTGSGAAAGVIFKNDIGDHGAISSLSAANSPASSLFMRTFGAYPVTFGTNNTERARITSGGDLCVGTTSALATGKISILFNEGTGKGIVIKNSNASNGGFFAEFFNSVGGQAGSITQSSATTVLYNVSSDQRLKENIQDADSASSLIDSLQVRKFDWKTDQTHQRYGFVAQELVTVVPEAVHQPKDAEQMMAVDYSKLVPMLVKEIQSLRKRLADAGI